MASIDERVVAMSFENTVFESRVSVTMATLTKLDHALSAIGRTSGLQNIEAEANKITLTSPMTALDKLKAKLGFPTAPQVFGDVETAANKVTLAGPSSAFDKLKAKLGFPTAPQAFGDVENAANKVTLQGPNTAFDRLKAKLGFPTAPEAFGDLERASSRVGFEAPSTAIDKLKAKLGFPEASRAFADIEKESSKVSFHGMSSAIDGISAKFGALEVAAIAALGTVVSRATLAGGQLVKSLSLGPLTQGFEEYATNLNSIQTILANTKASGADLDDVNATLQELNRYSDQTIYNFSEMAKNIGTFTAAGVDLKTSAASIKGIANLAALSGSNSQQAATAMYQLSQAISSGRVSLQDWNSVVNAGMGGTVFQRALAQTAEKMGTLGDGAVKLQGKMKNVTIEGESFRESIQAKPGEESWLTSKVLTNTLQQFTGDLSDAELAAQGFNKEQIKAIQQTAETAKKAATEVKTIKGVFDVVKESIGSGWAATFQIIFGDFEEAKKTFTDLSNFITKFTGGLADARNEMLKEWKALGGREELIKGLKAAFDALISVLKPIKDAFRDIFPAKTGEQLFELTKRFREFMENLKVSDETAKLLRRTFAGFFAILSIGKTIVGEILGVVADLLGVAGKGSAGFLSFTAGIGDFLVALDKAISKGKGLSGFFEGLTAVLRVPLEVLQAVGSAVASLFGADEGDKAKRFGDAMDDVKGSLEPLGVVIDIVVRAWEKLVNVLNDLQEAVYPWLQEIGEQFKAFSDIVMKAFEGANFDKIFTAVQTGLIGGIFLSIKKALSGGLDIDFGSGALSKLGDTLEAVTNNLQAMQRNLQATALLKIGAAIAVLAAGIFVLSTIPPKKLSTAMTAVAVGLGQLVAAMALLSKAVAAGGLAGFLAMPVIAAGMLIMAGAMVVLAGAMKIFATMSWEDLAKGLLGVGGGLAAVGAAVKLIGPQIVLAGIGMIPLAIAMNILAVAVKIFASLSWEELAKGLIGAAGALAGIAAAMLLMPPTMILMGPSLIAVAFAMTLLAGAVSAFGSLKLTTLAKGILAVAAALGVIGIAIGSIPPTIALQAAGLVILAVALTGISAAIGVLGNMKMGTLAKGLIAMGAALAILAVGLIAMIGTLPGSVALLAAAAALAILAPTLGFLGTLSWGTILKGLVAIAAVLGVLAVVGALAAGPLALLGGALAALGVGVLAISAGIYLLAKGLALLGTDGVKGVTALMLALTALVAIMPKIVVDFLEGLVTILAELAKLAPAIVESLIKIATQLLEGIVRLAPKAAEAIGALILAILRVLNENSPRIIDAGWKLLMNLLRGIRNNIGKVTQTVGEIITKFLDAQAKNMPRIVASGVKLLVSFLNAITDHLPRVVATVARLISTFLNNVAKHIPQVIASGANLIVKWLKGIADQIPKIIAAGVRIIVKFLDGITDAIPRVAEAAVRVARKFLNTLADTLVKLVDIGFNAIIRFLNGLARAIRENDDKMWNAGYNIASAIIEGLLKGLANLGPKVVKAVGGLIKSLPDKALGILGIGSPSKVFIEIGKQTMLGMAVGLERGGIDVERTMTTTARDVIKSAKTAFDKVPSMLDGLLEMEPVITPVLDLTKVERNAKKLGDLANVVPITAAASFGQAAAISEQQRVAERAEAAQVITNFSYEQNNYSPDPLSDIEIYRRTNNQLSQVKSALGVTR